MAIPAIFAGSIGAIGRGMGSFGSKIGMYRQPGYVKSGPQGADGYSTSRGWVKQSSSGGFTSNAQAAGFAALGAGGAYREQSKRSKRKR